MNHRILSRILSTAAFVSVNVLLVNAQTAQLTGRVTDPSGAVVPAVTVSVKSAESGVETRNQTNQEGYYHFPSVPPGTYNVWITKEGFTPVRHLDLRLAVQQVARLDVTLQVGSITQSVEVSAQAVLLDSETSTLGQIVGGKQITELPLLGRNPYALANLVPGVRAPASWNNLPVNLANTQFASINGARANQNLFLLDGAPNTDSASNGPVLFPNPDFFQEFKIETNSFSAEYGRAAGGVFNVVTRAGSNDPHFVLYEFLRNDKLNANNWFANRAGTRRPPFRMNQFGGSAGGPVVIPRAYDGRNKTFFFGNAEFVRLATGVTVTTTMPTAAQLAGDFSATRNAADQVIQIFDPFSTRPNPAGSGFIRTPFPGNVIPVSRIDPVARSISRFYPPPNTSGDPVTGVQNFSRSSDADRIRKDTVSFRVDHYFPERHRFFARFSYDDTPTLVAPAYGREYTISTPTSGPQSFGRRNVVVEDVYTFTPTLLATWRASYSRVTNFRTPYSNGFDITTLGFPAGLARQMGEPFAFPGIRVTGFGDLGHTGVIRSGSDTWAWQSNLRKSLARHNLRTGFEYWCVRLNPYQFPDVGRLFSFSNEWTQGPDPSRASATAGLALASFLLGVGSGSVNITPAPAQQVIYYGLFLQDDFKVTPRLTLNLGLRYDYETPLTDRFNQLTNFDYRLRPPLNAPGLDLRGALTFVGVNGASRSQAEPDRNNLAPRVGFAFKATPHTVLRAGAGIFVGSTTDIGFGTSGFSATTTLVTSLDGVTPLNTLSNPYPDGITQPTGSKLGPATLLGQGVSFYDRGNRKPYSGQWNFNIQQQLRGGILFDVAYAGSRGLKYPLSRTLNQLPDAALALGQELRAQAPNPFFGQIASGPLSQRTVSRAQLLRPFPHFDAATSTNANWGSSSYHSLQVKVEKRYSQGFLLHGAYTFSKLMDMGTGAWAGEALGGGNIQNWNDLRSEWAVSSLNQTHRLVINPVYELPVGKNLRGVSEKLLTGWEVAAIFSAFSGGPLGVASAVNTTFSQGGGQRPNWSGVKTKLSNPAPTQWFDTSQFSNPEPFRFGNAPRTFSDSRSDGEIGLNLTLAKATRLTEKLKLQFRAEFFNLTNTPKFGVPNTSFGSPLFGVVSAQANQPRIVQFGLKLLR
ncbi:MAG: TonB-dependent receptor [Acidobacteria bacterium]|nr:TonB-dependent receptor [Acidobacteriota bacterium]